MPDHQGALAAGVYEPGSFPPQVPPAPGLPAEASEVLAAALSPDPRARPTATELRDSLAEAY